MINNIAGKELFDLRENYQLEVKSAQGHDGNCKIPNATMNKVAYNIRLLSLQHLTKS